MIKSKQELQLAEEKTIKVKKEWQTDEATAIRRAARSAECILEKNNQNILFISIV
ncbi:MAG: hypothetical protein IC227_07375 [Enterococcus lacertideformus]|uniref:Uncharacterized protein n=1 Tax=Enterococcus lacertideformus TaxID=2771493 RepID=A0A931FBZ5_9ENTE|nr:hypothetical protein [Enterococcus lacertideformus]